MKLRIVGPDYGLEAHLSEVKKDPYWKETTITKREVDGLTLLRIKTDRGEERDGSLSYTDVVLADGGIIGVKLWWEDRKTRIILPGKYIAIIRDTHKPVIIRYTSDEHLPAPFGPLGPYLEKKRDVSVELDEHNYTDDNQHFLIFVRGYGTKKGLNVAAYYNETDSGFNLDDVTVNGELISFADYQSLARELGKRGFSALVANGLYVLETKDHAKEIRFPEKFSLGEFYGLERIISKPVEWVQLPTPKQAPFLFC